MFVSRIAVSQQSRVAVGIVVFAVSVGVGFLVQNRVQGACAQACNVDVACTYDHTESGLNGAVKGWLYQNGCNRLINSETSDGNNTQGSVDNQYKTATVVKICPKTVQNLQGTAQTNCGADPSSTWTASKCGSSCVTK
jgi:hypothetical protein